MKNLSAIVWLYRGHQPRFLALVQDYLRQLSMERAAIAPALSAFEATLAALRKRFAFFVLVVEKHANIEAEKKQGLIAAIAELTDAKKPYETDRAKLLAQLDKFANQYAKAPPKENDKQHAARKAFDPISDAIRGLIKQVDLLYKLTAHVADLGTALANEAVGDGEVAIAYDRRAASKLIKQLDAQRKAAVEQLKHAVYFQHQGPPNHQQEKQTARHTAQDSRRATEAHGELPTPSRVAARPLPQGRVTSCARVGEAREPQGHRSRRLEPHPRPLRRRRPAGGR